MITFSSPIPRARQHSSVMQSSLAFCSRWYNRLRVVRVHGAEVEQRQRVRLLRLCAHAVALALGPALGCARLLAAPLVTATAAARDDAASLAAAPMVRRLAEGAV